MDSMIRFDDYLAHLAAGLRHADREVGLRGYCSGLMLPLARKSVDTLMTVRLVNNRHATAISPAVSERG